MRARTKPRLFFQGFKVNFSALSHNSNEGATRKVASTDKPRKKKHFVLFLGVRGDSKKIFWCFLKRSQWWNMSPAMYTVILCSALLAVASCASIFNMNNGAFETLNSNDDGSVLKNLPSSFPYFGSIKNQIYVSVGFAFIWFWFFFFTFHGRLYFLT